MFVVTFLKIFILQSLIVARSIEIPSGSESTSINIEAPNSNDYINSDIELRWSSNELQFNLNNFDYSVRDREAIANKLNFGLTRTYHYVSGNEVSLNNNDNGDSYNFNSFMAVKDNDGVLRFDSTGFDTTRDGTRRTASSLTYTNVNDVETLFAEDVYVDENDGNTYTFGTLNITRTDDFETYIGTNVETTQDDWDGKAEEITLTDDENGRSASATNFKVQDESGLRLSFESAIYNKDNNGNESLSGTGVSGSDDEYGGSARTLSYSESNTSANLSATDASIRDNDDNHAFFTNLNVMSYDSDNTFDVNASGEIRQTGNSTPLSFDISARKLEDVSYNERKESGVTEGKLNIQTTSEGGISNIHTKLGNSISFEATDADGNASKLNASFYLDENTGKFFLEARLEDGDNIEIKILPFTFSSEQVSNEAVIRLSAELNEQNIGDYLSTVTGLLDFQNVNNMLSVGDGQLKVRLGSERNGIEMFYSNPKYRVHGESSIAGDEKLALGAGLFNRDAQGTVKSAGFLLTADSSLTYDIQHGSLSIGGVDIPDRGEIPLTLGAYWSRVDEEGNAIFSTIGTPLANFAKDQDDLGLSAAVAYRRQLGENLTMDTGVAVHSYGDQTASIMFDYTFPKNSSGISIDERGKGLWEYSQDERREILTRPERSRSQ